MRKQTLILGASSGIGYATALHLANQNHDILGVARREKELLKLKKEHPSITIMALDLLTPQSFTPIQNYFKSITHIDYIVVCTGRTGPFLPLTDLPTEELNRTLNLDVITPLLLIQSLSQFFHNTRILFIDSLSAKTPRQNWGIYSIGKAAQKMMVHCLQKESIDNLLVGSYFPGAVDTPIFREAVSTSQSTFPDQPVYQSFVDHNRVKTPEESAKEICNFLLNSTPQEFGVT